MRFLTFLSFYFYSFSIALADITLIPKESDNASLAMKFKTGDLQISDIVIYIKYLTDQLVIIASIVAVLVIMFGGYQNILKSYSGDDTSGNEYIKKALTGLAVVAFSWVFVDFIFRLVVN